MGHSKRNDESFCINFWRLRVLVALSRGKQRKRRHPRKRPMIRRRWHFATVRAKAKKMAIPELDTALTEHTRTTKTAMPMLFVGMPVRIQTSNILKGKCDV